MEIGFGDDGFGSHSCNAKKKKKEITKARAEVKNLDSSALEAGLDLFCAVWGSYCKLLLMKIFSVHGQSV